MKKSEEQSMNAHPANPKRTHSMKGRLTPRFLWALTMSILPAVTAHLAAQVRPPTSTISPTSTASKTAAAAVAPDLLPVTGRRVAAVTPVGGGFCRFSPSGDPPSDEYHPKVLVVDVGNIGTAPAGSQRIEVTYTVWNGGVASKDKYSKNNDDSIPPGGKTPTPIKFEVPRACSKDGRCAFTIRVQPQAGETNTGNNSVSAVCNLDGGVVKK